MSRIGGHFWTLYPHLRERLPWRRSPSTPRPWQTSITGADGHRFNVRGQLRGNADATTALIVLHGLGGSLDSPYLRPAIRAADERGWMSLNLALRGADRDGEDLYHAGHTDELHGALASPELASVERIFVMGFSLGGHITLHLAHELSRAPDPRVGGIAAICAPLDLAVARAHIDAPKLRFYRRHILAGLLACYEAAADREHPHLPALDPTTIRSILEWDRRIIVPRYGLGSTERYYAEKSVAPLLPKIEMRTLTVHTRRDPIVPAAVVAPALTNAGPGITSRWINRGGHLGAPRGALQEDVLRWFEGSA